MTGTEQQILEKVLQKERRFPNSFFEIAVIGSDQRIAEIAAVVLEQLIGNLKTERPQIFDGKDRRGARIAFGKRMNLPQPGDKKGDVGDGFPWRQSLITEPPLLFEIVIQCRTQFEGGSVQNRLSLQNPLLFGDVVIAQHAGKPVNAVKQLFV